MYSSMYTTHKGSMYRSMRGRMRLIFTAKLRRTSRPVVVDCPSIAWYAAASCNREKSGISQKYAAGMNSGRNFGQRRQASTHARNAQANLYAQSTKEPPQPRARNPRSARPARPCSQRRPTGLLIWNRRTKLQECQLAEARRERRE